MAVDMFLKTGRKAGLIGDLAPSLTPELAMPVAAEPPDEVARKAGGRDVEGFGILIIDGRPAPAPAPTTDLVGLTPAQPMVRLPNEVVIC